MCTRLFNINLLMIIIQYYFFNINLLIYAQHKFFILILNLNSWSTKMVHNAR